MNQPWIIGGDFNVVLNSEENLGGLPVIDADTDDFRSFIESCDLDQMNFKGSLFTWWNSRASDDIIFERLDRVLFNSDFQDLFAHLEVEHLPRNGSDYAPLLIYCSRDAPNIRKHFIFLNL